MTTGQLAGRIGADREAVYRECRRLERQGRLASVQRRGARRVFFYPMTREVVTSANYDRVKELDGDLRVIIGAHAPPAGKAALRSALRGHFSGLYARADLAPYVDAIKEFEEELLRAVRDATTRSEVTGHLGIRGFFPQVIVWRRVR